MAHDRSADSTTAWPLASIRFEVMWDGAVLTFQDVEGLVVERSPGDTRASALDKPGKVTLKNGLFHGASSFRDWFDRVKMSTVARKPMTICLLDDSGQSALTWTLARAWPAQVTGTGLDTDGDEAALQTLVVAHEGLAFATA
ncbi:MAG: phage tail protein [Betaproteobacteria bacterium]